MEKQYLHVELLLGKRVLSVNGRSVGRIEEIRAKVINGDCFVTEFLVGSYAVLDRLSAWIIRSAVLRLLRARRKGGYRIPWDKLDLSDPQQPGLSCSVSELMPLQEGSSVS